MASLALRCFWEGYSAGSGRGGNSFKKTAALMAALLAEFPTKRFYLKVDADSVLRPQNLLLFLARVAKRMDSTAAAAPTTATATAAKGNVPAAPPLYFGSAFAPPICPYADARCKNIKSFSFNFGPSTAARAARGEMRLRESVGWAQLQSSIMRTAREQRVMNKTHLTYAQGGVYGASRSAIERLVQSRCMERLGRVHCGPVGRLKLPRSPRCTKHAFGEEMHAHEDAAFGLCMSLVSARLLHCDCFHMQLPLYNWSWSGPTSVAGSTLPPALHGLHARVGSLTQSPQKARQRRVEQAFATAVPVLPSPGFGKFPLPRGADALCQKPIALHPVKEPREQLDWWSVLEAREHQGSRR